MNTVEKTTTNDFERRENQEISIRNEYKKATFIRVKIPFKELDNHSSPSANDTHMFDICI